jgi:hypothetical protein
LVLALFSGTVLRGATTMQSDYERLLEMFQGIINRTPAKPPGYLQEKSAKGSDLAELRVIPDKDGKADHPRAIVFYFDDKGALVTLPTLAKGAKL